MSETTIDEAIVKTIEKEKQVQILGVGTATPPNAYTQQELIELFDITDERTQGVYLNSCIEKRYLSLPAVCEVNGFQTESQGQLLSKHKEQAVIVGAKALMACLEGIDFTKDQVASLCCVTSTGLLTPGLSALLIKAMDLSPACNRWDIVGMGCNAGLNGLNAATSWALANPGKLSIVLCIEMCSAAYVKDGTLQTNVVNSLFGDGASAAALMANTYPKAKVQAKVEAFSSHIITEAQDAMKFDWSDDHGKFSFFLARDVPYVVGANIEVAVKRLLAKTGLRKSQINHWVIHSGGKKVIDSIKINLGLSGHDVRHTLSVLRDYGNVSSGSFLFSFERLLQEKSVQAGDRCMMITMGPGATIETALIQF